MRRSKCPQIADFLILTTILLLVTTALPVLATTADHLIISEVLIKTRAPVSTFGSPFIEIVNPTGVSVPMGNVYLTDGTTQPSTYYFNITHLDLLGAYPGGGVGGDFHAKFPAGYSISAGDTIAISLNGSTEYLEAYGRAPDFELFEDGLSPDGVPELEEAFQGSINAGLSGGGNFPVLSDIAESLILYSWDGEADLVHDLDYLMWGTNLSPRIDKTGISVGGGSYLSDTAVESQEAAASAGPTFGSTMRRISSEEGTETVSGGNGSTGHDETSENLATTFPTVVGHQPPTSNPLFPAAPIFTEGYHSPFEPTETQSVNLQVAIVDQGTLANVSFLYSVDGAGPIFLSGIDQGAGDWTASVPSQAAGAEVTWYCIAANSLGGAAVFPAGSPNFAYSWTVAADPIPGNFPAKLLMTEISTIGTDQEFIEIFNPGAEAVDLSNYYLTDANYSPNNQFYYRIGEGNPSQVTVGGGEFADFHARFPDGFMIAAGDTIVISVPGSTAFFSSFGFHPDLELFEDDPTPDTVPDMRWIFGVEGENSIIGSSSVPSLTNSAETVILYHFIEGEYRVTDIDVFTWKDPSSTTVSQYFNKTGVTIGTHSYLPEVGTNVNDAFATQNDFGNSYQRTGPTEGDQTPTGSNGVDGRDETSEDYNTTFTMLPYDPSGPTAPVPSPDKLLLTEISTTGTNEEYIEIHNPGISAVDLSNYYLTDATYITANIHYWRIAEGNLAYETVGGGQFFDFHARFPDGFAIAAGDTIVISLAGSLAFSNSFGILPDLEFYEDDIMSDSVPDMRWIFGDAVENSIFGVSSTPGLTNAAETVILYHFLEGEDKVTDIDVFAWKDSSSTTTSHFFNKTGVTIGNHSYLPEFGTNDSDAFGTQNDFGNSYQRTDLTEGDQTPTGSNGVDGRDETSENYNTTFSMLPWAPSGKPLPGPSPGKLLITEVSTIPTPQEYIEIFNPGTEEVDLSDYYLTDAIYTPGNQVYWRIAEGNPSQASVGGGAFGDFHARFPEGFSLAAGDTIVISILGSNDYLYNFGFYPHLELFEDDPSPDTIPDMRWIFGDEINNSIINRTGSGTGQPSTPGLTNGGETVVLYHWITGEDKVVDIDVFAHKDPSYLTTSYFFNKTGVVVGSHSYLPEMGTNASDAFGLENSVGTSYHRTDPAEGDQTPTGSNGVDGRDETSENFNTTFAQLPYDPARPSGSVVPAVGDWQLVGSGPMVEHTSSAHAWGDYQGDGGIDLVLARPDPGADHVLVNNVHLLVSGPAEFLTGDGVRDVTECVWGDYDQDGDLDFFTTKSSGADWIFQNYGEEWNWYLLGWPVSDLGVTPTINSTGANMVDTDLDGWLEIFVTNGSGNNQLLDGRFGLTDLMPSSLFHAPGTLGSAWCDLDGDRDPDLVFVSASSGVAVSMQDESRRFNTTWLPAPAQGRDVAFADYDNDGDFDFVLICDGGSNILHENLGDGSFAQTALAGAGSDSTTGCSWGDYDNDGFQDLHVTNAGSPNVLWHNATGGQFTAVVDTVIGHPGDDRATSWIDIDTDGDLDLYISSRDQNNRLVRNNLDTTDSWVQIALAGHHWGNQSNHGAIGAVIEVEADGMVQRRHVGGQEAGSGHSPPVQHFGLGGATIVERITVQWPFRLPNGSFHSTEIRDVGVNGLVQIEESVYGVSAADPVPSYSNSLQQASPNPFNPVTSISYSLEKESTVSLDIFDVRGRLVHRLVSGQTMNPGLYRVEWRGKTLSGADAPSGVYLYRLKADGFSATRRMVLIR